MSDDVQQGLGQDALLSEALDEDVALSFGQFAAVVVEQQRQVRVGGRRPSQRAEQLQVFGGGDQPLGAAQHVTDAHVMVVHHVGQVVRGEAVGLQDDRISLHRRHLVPRPAEDRVPEGLGAGVQLEADRARDSPGQFLLDLLRPQQSTPVVVPEAERFFFRQTF